MGHQDMTIQFNESGSVSLLAVEGNVMASPMPSFVVGDNLVRQSLLTLVNPGARANDGSVSVVSHPPGTNHSVNQHLFSTDVKVTGSGPVVVPVNYHFDAHPVSLPMKQLTMHFFNASYRGVADGGGYFATEFLDGIDVEVQLVLTYEVTTP